MARAQPTTPDENLHDDRVQLHNKNYKVVVKATGQVFYGTVSRVDYEAKEFYLLKSDQPGMIGKDGVKFSWDDCTVMAERDRVGSFTDNMVNEWENWWRKSGVETKL